MAVLAFGGLSLWAYLHYNPQFGGQITAQEKGRFANSPAWNGEMFKNQIEISMDLGPKEIPGLLYEQLFGDEKRRPDSLLPLAPFPTEQWAQGYSSAFQFIWYGHSVGLMRMAGLNLLIDPMFGPDASPIGPFRTERFSTNTLRIIDELPAIDAVFITHDHYDHLDYASFQKLKGKVKHYYVPLGVKRHLLRWQIPEEQITTFDWWDQATLGPLKVHFVPSRHFSGRGISDRAESLWGGWVFNSSKARVYWSGDGGYGPHFKAIGERLGPFDWAFLECGQYNERWHAVHLYPEESIQAAREVQAKVAIPIHWGAFNLALHAWKDPVQRFEAAARRQDQTIAYPRLGQMIRYRRDLPTGLWWKDSVH